MPGNNPLERCYYFDELHDSHVDAWIKSLPGPSTPPLYAEEVWELGCQLWDLEHGPCEDVARKQERIEELETRLHSISPDCTRKVEPNKTVANGKNKPDTRVSIAKVRKERAMLRGKQLHKENPKITIDEIIKDPVLLQIWPTKKKPSVTYLKRLFEGSGITNRGRRKAH